MVSKELHPLLDISKVDFSNVEEIESYAGMVFACADRAGMFMSATPLRSKEAMTVSVAARNWLDAVKTAIDTMTAGDALALIDSYDMMHRIAYCRQSPRQFTDRYKLQAFDARIHGDKSVDQYILFRAIDAEIKRQNKQFFGKPLQWYSLTLDSWYNEFKSGRSARPLSVYDTLQRVTILLQSDLRIFESRNEAAYKQLLFENHRHYLDKITAYDFRTLRAGIQGYYLSTQFDHVIEAAERKSH